MPRRVLKVILLLESGKESQNQRQRKQNRIPRQVHPLRLPALPSHPLQRLSPPEPQRHFRSLQIRVSRLDVVDLTNSPNFSNTGIDSLLGLITSARFREELNIDPNFNALS